jgi:hypothetical protein
VVVERNTKNVMARIVFKAFFGLIACLLSVQANAQGKVVVHADERIENGLNEYVASIDTNEIAGYRVQVFFGSNKFDADKAKEKVIEACPLMKDKVYVIYQSPNYKVRVGNFEREVDAQATLRILGELFPNVFVVRDRIEMFRQLLSCE